MFSQYKCQIQNHIDEPILGVQKSKKHNRMLCKKCLQSFEQDKTIQLLEVENEDYLNKIIQEFNSQLQINLKNVLTQSGIHRSILIKEISDYVDYWQIEYQKWTYLESLVFQLQDKIKEFNIKDYIEDETTSGIAEFLNKQTFKDKNDIESILSGKHNYVIQQKILHLKEDFVENFKIELSKLDNQINENIKLNSYDKLLFMIRQSHSQHQQLNICERLDYRFFKRKEDIQKLLGEINFENYITDDYQQNEICKKGKLMAEFGQFDLSLHYYDQIIKLFPKNYESYHQKAQTYIKQKNYEKVFECYDQFIKIDPTNYHAHFHKGDVYQNQSLFIEALQCYDRCIQIDQTNYNAYQRKAALFERQHKYKEAIECYDQYIKINPTYYDVYYLKGCLYRKLNNLEEAINTFNKYIEKDPNHYYAHFMKVQSLLDLNKVKEALESCDQCIKIDPTNYQAYEQKAQIYRSQSNFAEIIQTYDSYISVVKTNYEPYYQKVLIFESQQLYKEAIECYEQCIQINPNHFYANINLAQLLNNQQRYEDAMPYYDKGIQIDPTNFYIYHQKAQILIQLNNQIGALEVYDQYIKVDPNVYEAYYNKAEIYIKLNNYQQAIGCYDQMIKIDPSNYHSYLNKAQIQEKCKDCESAIRTYHQFIDTYPTHHKVAEIKSIDSFYIRTNSQAIVESSINRMRYKIIRKYCNIQNYSQFMCFSTKTMIFLLFQL